MAQALTARARHIVFATTGSLGDLHPFLALGCELRERGFRVTVATCAGHEAVVVAAALEFYHMRPDPQPTAAFHARYMHPVTGGEFVYRDYLAPAIRDSYADLLQAVSGADLLVSQTLMALAAPLVAARTGIAWVSAVLQPMAFFSIYERPNYLPNALSWLCARSPAMHARLLYYVKKHTEKWLQPVLDLCTELGQTGQGHPLYEGQHAPARVLAMFSPLMGTAQPDWPVAVIQTGTALYAPASAPLSTALKGFLETGTTPLIIFTLSSASSNDAGNFYLESLKAASALQLRALLIMGGLAKNSYLPEPLPPSAFRIDYVAFEKVFSYAAVIVHSGGIATSFKALQSGKPQVVVPHAHDQRDNGQRLQALGLAKVVSGRRPGWKTLCAALQCVLADGTMRERAAALGNQARDEMGVRDGCDAIEAVLAHA